MRRITAFGDWTNYLGSNCLFDGDTQTVLIAMNKTHTLYYHIYVSTLCFVCVNGSWLNINSACRCCCCCVYCRRVSGSYQIAHTSPYIYIRAHRCNNHKLIIKRYIYIYVICMYVYMYDDKRCLFLWCRWKCVRELCVLCVNSSTLIAHHPTPTPTSPPSFISNTTQPASPQALYIYFGASLSDYSYTMRATFEER